jgi:glycerophosphoryl diester phosphodiesterase
MTRLADPFRIIAHRGASGYAPENTMAAFKRAVAMGCVEVETDVCFTKDRRLLLLHDDTLDRTTDGSGRPEDFTLDELGRLDAGSWTDERLSWDRDYSGERLITLEELLDAFGTALTYHVEIKNPTPGLVPAIIAAVAERGLLDRVFIAAVDDDASLQEAMRLAPGIRVACAPVAALRADGPRAIERCAANGYAMVTLNASNQSRELVELAHSLGMEARSSGIATRDRMIAATEIGCNGMTINWPDWLMDHVRDPRGDRDGR